MYVLQKERDNSFQKVLVYSIQKYQCFYCHTTKHSLVNCENINIEYDIKNVKNLSEKTLGERVKKLRLSNNMSIKLLANKCKLSPQTISNIEKDRNFPSISTINILSKILNSSNDYLLQLSKFPEDSIGQIIKKYRLKKGLTQDDLAKKCNLHKATIKDYEDNRIKSKTDTLTKIYQELNIK